MDSAEILLVDDNPNDVKLTLHEFDRYQIKNTVQVLGSGEEALDYMFCRGSWEGRDVTDHPRLVLLDIGLPGVDGLEVLRQVKSDLRTTAVPVVLLTGSDDEANILASKEVGADGYIIKPLNFDQFIAQVWNAKLYRWLLEPEERAEGERHASWTPQ